MQASTSQWADRAPRGRAERPGLAVSQGTTPEGCVGAPWQVVPAPIVVVSHDGQRRSDWSHELAREGQQVIRCAARDCPLLRGEHCEILGQAAAAVYDEETISPELFLALVRTPMRPTILFARDAQSDGRHHARYTRVLDPMTAANSPHPR